MITVIGNNAVITAMGLAGVQKLIEISIDQDEAFKEVVEKCESKILVVGNSLADKHSNLLKQFPGIVVNLPEKNFDDSKDHLDVIAELIKDTLGIELNDD